MSQPIEKKLDEKILVLDGAMGSALMTMNLSARDFGGEKFEGCFEALNLTRPSAVEFVHESYLKAGCDIIETNTFGGTPFVLDEYGLGSKAHEINKTAALIARKLADQYSTPAKPRFVAGSIGPTTKALSVTGGTTFEKLFENFYVQAKGLVEGGVDYLLLETCQDTRNVKAGLLAIEKLKKDLGRNILTAVSGTIEPMGTMLGGQSIESLYVSLSHFPLLYLGLNCATGPEFMTDHLRSLSSLSHFRTSCVPNAGLPDEHGHYLETASMLSNVLARFLENGWINLVGGCCGTNGDHISALVELAAKFKPRQISAKKKSYLSGVDFLEITDEMRPVLVGERTNVIGSKKFKRLICDEKFEDASEIAKSQIRKGAQIVDVCLANPDRDEFEDMQTFLSSVIKKIRVPLMIDSTDDKVIEMALTYSQGKAIINSVNLEDGEERFEKVLPLAKKYGAALVVGTIDDDPQQGMAVTRERTLAVAKRSYDLLTGKFGFPEEDIYWDPLVFPCATGDVNYVGSALETIEGIRLIKKAYPKTKTVLGISNVSFGLPESGREVLNSVFLYHCVQAGLDLAIVNSEKLERYSSISEEERLLSENLLFNRTEAGDPIAAFAAHFREKKVEVRLDRHLIPLEDRLAHAIVDGSREGLIDDLNEALKKFKPLEIINGPLMKGMDEVGKLFNENKLIVAEVLQSAEVMKLAVSHLEPFMEKTESSNRGKIILATVKGDVHDIGKNLVDIILSNNGFKVINLGIKIPPDQLILAAKEHKPDMIGLSGLLVKSAQQMVVTAEDLARAGIHIPILVGGAALSSGFVDRYISKMYGEGTVAYASDAMQGLELAKTIVDPVKFAELNKELTSRRSNLQQKNSQQLQAEIIMSHERSKEVALLSDLPQPSDFERHVLRNTPIEQIWKFINPLMLYSRHLGIRGGVVRKLEAAAHDKKLQNELEQTEPKAFALWNIISELKEELRTTDFVSSRAVFQFFKAGSSGNKLSLYASSTSQPLATFDFPRQKKVDGLCISDYVSPHQAEEPVMDNVALFVTTVGSGIRAYAEELKEKGEYLKSHALQALIIESAEAYAELLHSKIRSIWGYPDLPDMTMMERFQAKYRGKRYSFGYPACPVLDDQEMLFKLLQPQEIGVELTEGFMMDPEASVSALVFHHPDAMYFSVGPAANNERI